MSRVLPSFSKQSDAEDYEYDMREELSPLIKQFAKSQIKSQPTAVEVARLRNSSPNNTAHSSSIVQQVNSIMHGKQRYATVDDVVKDMTERTGLGEYLNTVKSAEESKKKVSSSNSSTEIFQLGFSDGKYDLDKNQVGDIRASMIHHHYINKIKNDPLAYAYGYADGSDWVNKFGQATLDREILSIEKIIEDYGSFSKWIDYLNKIHGRKEASSAIPESLTKYDFADKVISYIHNNIENSNAYSVKIPALQFDILNVFGTQGLQSQDVMNDEFAKYLSDCIYEAQKTLPLAHHNSNIGKNVGKDLEDSNDAWANLMPAK